MARRDCSALLFRGGLAEPVSLKMRFYKMVDFPVSPVVGEEFPKVTETKPGQFGAKYHYWTGRAGGWLMGDTADGSGKRRYPFRVICRIAHEPASGPTGPVVVFGTKLAWF